MAHYVIYKRVSDVIYFFTNLDYHQQKQQSTGFPLNNLDMFVVGYKIKGRKFDSSEY